jgi:FtsP/CotA-like multicopper oxidase with cupredoxin domain
MGDLSDDDRSHGMGIVVEYAGHRGKPVWTKPAPFRWDYTRFGRPSATPATPDETIVVTVAKENGAIHFLADNPGPTLFHCHQQLHMDFGFMALFHYAA